MLELNKIYCGDNLTLIKQLDDNSVDLTVTSPPYDNLRTYNGYSWDFEGLAKELFRVTKDGGVVVWVVGDATINGSETGTSFRQALYFMECGFRLHDTMIYEKNGSSFPASQDSNRYTQIYEFMFVFSKEKPKKTTLICDKENRWSGCTSFGKSKIRDKNGELKDKNMKPIPSVSPRNNIWKYSTGENYSTKDKIAYAHPAIFPEKLAEDHIISWSNKGDLILDPFMGSGTTAKMALKNQRNFIGFELSQEYCNIANRRIEGWKTQTRLF